MWGEFAFEMSLSVVLTVVKQAIHDPKKKAAVRRALLKVRDAITALYPEDSEATASLDSGSPVA